MSSLSLEETPAEVKRYERQKLVGTLSAIVLNLAALGVLALWVGPDLDGFVRHSLTEKVWLRLSVLGLIYAFILELLTLPLDYWSGYILERRYQLTDQTRLAWIWRRIKGYLVAGPLGLGLLWGLYALLWFAGSWWWLWAAAAWLVVSLLLGQLLPVVILPLFYKVVPLQDDTLAGRLLALAQGTGLKIEGVYRLELSAVTRKANAALAGLGRTRRVLLGDTLLDQFDADEIEVVFAHEVGHHVHRHLLKLIILSVITTLVGLYVTGRLVQVAAAGLGYEAAPGLEPYQDPSALPLFMLAGSLFVMALAPMQNALSRFFERQCDRYALERTQRPDAYRSAFVKLARMNKVDPDPHPLVVWLFDDHPPIRERLAQADGFAQQPAG